MRDKRTGKTKGYGFVSFTNPLDLTAALKEMNGNALVFITAFDHRMKPTWMILENVVLSGKYVGNRPIKLRKSKWKDRIDYEALERLKVFMFGIGLH